MILALILLQAAVPYPAPEIEVTGKRLARLRLALDLGSDGLTDCRIEVSSGDAFVDRQACPAATLCAQGLRHDYAPLLACIDDRIASAVREHDAPSDR